MRVVAALGGNALLERGEPPDSDIQQGHVASAVAALAPLGCRTPADQGHCTGWALMSISRVLVACSRCTTTARKRRVSS